MARDEVGQDTLLLEIAANLRHAHAVPNCEIEPDSIGVTPELPRNFRLVNELGYAGDGILIRLGYEKDPVTRLSRQVAYNVAILTRKIVVNEKINRQEVA